MSHTKKIAVLITAAATGMATAVASPGGPDELAGVRLRVTQKFAGREVVGVQATPLQGIFEVLLSPPQIVYTDARAEYVLAGALIDMAGQRNITAERLARLTHIDFRALPFEHAIKTVRGRGERKLAVFSDPDCPYCKRLERDTLAKLDNVTIYTFLFPLDQHADAARKAALIWCAGDRANAWADWMNNGRLPSPSVACSAPLAANIEAGKKLGISATPTMVTENGERVAGAVDGATLEPKLARPTR